MPSIGSTGPLSGKAIRLDAGAVDSIAPIIPQFGVLRNLPARPSGLTASVTPLPSLSQRLFVS